MKKQGHDSISQGFSTGPVFEAGETGIRTLEGR